jgi:hypothetical protein
MSIDPEFLADLPELSARKLRSMVRDQPLLFVGAALATGFIAGGGWRTRVGRMIALAAARYAASQAVEHYFNA